MSVVKRTQRYLHETLEESPVSKYGLLINTVFVFITVPLFIVEVLYL